VQSKKGIEQAVKIVEDEVKVALKKEYLGELLEDSQKQIEKANEILNKINEIK
jgi:hypothetical protein